MPFTEPQKAIIVTALDLQLKDLDKLFKACIKSGRKDAAEKVAAAITLARDTRAIVTDGIEEEEE